MLTKKWIPTISSDSRVFFNWEGILGSYLYGVRECDFYRYFPYVVKLRVFFSIPRM